MKSTSFSLLLLAASASSVFAKGQAGHRVKRQFGNHGNNHVAKRDLGLASALTVNNATSALANSTSSASSNGTAPVFTSTAVYTHFDGGESACLQYNKDEDLIFGVSEHFWNITWTSYGASPVYCGIPVEVTNTKTNKTVRATVQENSGQMDWVLCSVGLFTALGGDLDVGELPVSFTFPKGTIGQVGLGALTVDGASAAKGSDDSTFSTSAVHAAAAVPVSTDGSAPTTTTTTKAATTTQAPTTTEKPTTTTSTVDYAAIESAKEEAAAESSKDAAAASSKASEAAASASAKASAEAASASSKASADAAWASSSSKAAAAAASSKASADAAYASSKVSADAAWASSSSKAAAAAQATSDAGSGGGSSSLYHGYITYYTQNGVAGACGTVAQDSDHVIALETSMYDNGANCGRKILITCDRTGKQAIGVARDECPTCETKQSIDLSVGLFMELSTEAIGMEMVSWKFIS